MGKNNTQKVEELRKLYNVKDYEGAYLGNVYILSKADPELLKNVDVDNLSEEDKQRYEIARAGQLVEKNDTEDKENIEYEKLKEITSEIVKKQHDIDDIEL